MRLFIIFVAIQIVYVLCQDDPVVRTQYGRVRGKVKQVNGHNYTAFLGIPYAAPPVGSLRFRPPRAPASWDDVIDTQSYPNGCPQDAANDFVDFGDVSLITDFPASIYNFTQNEDCLYLNVFVTGEITESTSLPVFVVIHGGGNVGGSAHEVPGQIFVTEGDPVVMVAIQYRLGAFGYMTSGDEHLLGMNGLKDQNFALRWVQNNIAQFGGDPGRVTINGESAGGENVLIHVLSPLSRGLFHKALVQSPPSAWRYPKPHSMRKYFIEFAEAINCSGSTERILECLRGKTWQEIKYNPVTHYRVTQMVIDGEFMPDSPHKLWRQGRYNSDVQITLGITDDDGDILIQYFAPSFFSSRDQDLETFEAIAPALLNALLSDLKTMDGDTITQFGNPLTNYDELRILLKGRYYDSADDSIDRARGLLEMSTHGSFLIYGYWILNQVLANSGSARMYVFAHRSARLGNAGTFPTNAFHGSDLPYQFGYVLDSSYGLTFTAEEEQLSRSMIKAWTSYAAGDPSFFTMSGATVEWPEWTEDNKNVLVFNTSMSENSFIDAAVDFDPVLDFWLTVAATADIEDHDNSAESDESFETDFLKMDEFQADIAVIMLSFILLLFILGLCCVCCHRRNEK